MSDYHELIIRINKFISDIGFQDRTYENDAELDMAMVIPYHVNKKGEVFVYAVMPNSTNPKTPAPHFFAEAEEMQ